MNILFRKPTSTFAGRISVRRRIVLLLTAYAAISAGILAALLLHMRDDTVASSENLMGAFARLGDDQTTRAIQSVERTLQDIDGRLSAAIDGDTASKSAIIAGFRDLVQGRPLLNDVTVVDERGRIVYDSNAGNIGIDLSDRPYFIHHREHPDSESYLGAPIRSRRTGEWIIPVTRARLRANGEFGGVIVGGVDPKFFDRIWTFGPEYQDLSVALIRDDGVLLMRSPFDEPAMGVSFAGGPIFLQLREGSRVGTTSGTSILDGKQRVRAYRRLADYPNLILVVGESMDRALAAWWRTVWIVAAGWVVTAIMLGGLASWLIREWKARHATQDRYRLLFLSNPYPVVVIDCDTRHFLAVNDATVEQYGWSREEFLTMTANDLYLPEDVPAANAMREDGAWGVTPAVQGLRHRRKNGTVFNVETSVRPIDLAGRPAVLALAHDVTARHAAEAQLRQSQKMEAVGQLTGGIAHDFNNILMVILANADALQEEENLDAATLAEKVDQIGKAVLRASELTRQLLAFSRKQPLNPKHTDLNDLVSDTGKLLHRALGEQIEIESAFADDLWTVNVDRAQLETALVNLCVNARDAMPGGGKLLIETRNVSLDKDNVTQANDVAPGDYAMLAVTDTGSGMPPETRAKVFEPFFTTKEVGKGTGLGLSMVYGFIKQSKGHITIHSEVGRGTTFRLYLPRNDGVQEEATVQQTAPLPRGTERILVVEDEPLVRASVAKQLQSLGYTVSQASDGAAGLASFEAAPQPYDLLLTDVVMPGLMNGKALADEVTRRWPQTKVVFISGYAENAVLQDGKADDGVLLLSKPFRKRDLAKILRQALDNALGPDHTLPEAA